ncbi:hypothetical protein ACLOJK_005318 [Asimina triloba]
MLTYKLQTKLRGEGGIKALLGMVRCGHPDVLAQVARGIANFAKCESRACSQGAESPRNIATIIDNPFVGPLYGGPGCHHLSPPIVKNVENTQGLLCAPRHSLGDHEAQNMSILLSQDPRPTNYFVEITNEERVSWSNGRSLLIEDGALPWVVQNANSEASPIRRHIELALCHLAQHEVNAKDMISGGALWELVRISRDCSREDIRNLARRTLQCSPTFHAELQRLHILLA